MKCYVCGTNIDERADGDCPRCGFPILKVQENDPDALEQIRQLAQTYRSRYYPRSSTITLEVYQNQIDGEHVTLDKTAQIVLASPEQLAQMEPGDIRWYPEKFARLEGEQTLSVSISNENGSNRSLKLKVPNPDIHDFWQVGVQLQENASFCIVIGKTGSFVSSRTVTLYDDL